MAKPKHNENSHRDELRPRRNVLQQRSPAQAEDVDVGQDGDQHESDGVGAREWHAEQREDYVVLRNCGNDVAHVGGGGDGERGDGATVSDGEEHPSVKEGNQVAVGFTEVNVLSAGVGKHRAQFGEGNAGAERNQAAEDPH